MKDDNNEVISNKLRIIVGIIFMGLLSIKLYSYIQSSSFEKYWVLIPFLLFLITYIAKELSNKNVISVFSLLLITIFSTIILGFIAKISIINNIYQVHEESVLVFSFFISLICFAMISYRNRKPLDIMTEDKDELFNLFYINTSKVHEIAMLIDNKIMKTIERDQSSQEILKSQVSMNVNKSGVGGTSINRYIENNNKKSVYESFEVKTTKSIMLRKIYSSIENNVTNIQKLGNIVLFKNIELEQRNTDDTVMVLNVLKDGGMKQLSKDDDFELNISKMMEEMLDDFSIDYTFKHKKNNYLIRIPYKSKEYFENSYSHNDLQLGKLSIIGIYRGEIDFSKIESISSKFLELFSESYKTELQRNNNINGGLLLSVQPNSGKEHEFKIEYHKLDGKYHLIDLIAIIQEINIKGGELSG
ncbi:hypothetical protein [Bacillus sp. T3]|uniref:hypothetical protein n=1 Tax=Bacillus sp. T3 TaxID=467262 RepID=UPI0029824971|nr:hypothetical protein [Bacillus sp. T3]